MKQIYFLILIICSSFLLLSCSGKVQTNKIPNNKKYILPKKNNGIKEQTMNTRELQKYSQALEEFFNKKHIIESDKEELQDIYQIGLDREYFYEDRIYNGAKRNEKNY